ncbi:MAG TPA: hypothetical protein PLZ86_08035 [bacterium]|nr:hypothetical protein [bacterium]
MRKKVALFATVLFAALFAACGSATEVGNPTGDLPRIVTGMLDESTIPDYNEAASKAESRDLTALKVYAQATEGADAEAIVGADGSFSLHAIVGKTYSFSVRTENETLGDFSFEQDYLGRRGPALRISTPGGDIELGVCIYEDGVFKPETEPRGYQGIEGGSGWGPGNRGLGKLL